MNSKCLCRVAAALLLGIPGAVRAQANAAAGRAADSLFAAKDYARAADAYEKLLRTDTTGANYWFQLGMSTANLQRYPRAAEAFVHASAQGPNPVAVYNAGAMFARLGQPDSAFVWLTRAANLGVATVKLLQTDDDLVSVRNDARFAKLLALAATPATPCVNAPENRRLDFWVGDWDVTTQGGTPTGRSRVDKVSDGCAVLENWTSARGNTGHSLNAYNPIEKQWQQYWVGAGGAVIEYRESTWDGPSVVYISRTAAGSGPGTISKLTFSPLPDGTVRQHAEASKDNGTTWATTYDFYYHRR